MTAESKKCQMQLKMGRERKAWNEEHKKEQMEKTKDFEYFNRYISWQ